MRKNPTLKRYQPLLPYEYVPGCYKVVSAHTGGVCWLLSLCESEGDFVSIHPDEAVVKTNKALLIKDVPEWWVNCYERDSKRSRWAKEWTKLYRKERTAWPRLHGLIIPEHYRNQPWYRLPRDFRSAVSITRNGRYFRMRSGKHKSLGNVPPFVLKSLNSNDLDILLNCKDEKKRVFVVRKIVQMALQHLLMSGQDNVALMVKDQICQKDGTERRLRLERLSVWKTLMSKISLLRSDGNSAIEAAIKLRPFVWAFQHPSEESLS